MAGTGKSTETFTPALRKDGVGTHVRVNVVKARVPG